jgi:hypothetical protein
MKTWPQWPLQDENTGFKHRASGQISRNLQALKTKNRATKQFVKIE